MCKAYVHVQPSDFLSKMQNVHEKTQKKIVKFSPSILVSQIHLLGIHPWHPSVLPCIDLLMQPLYVEIVPLWWHPLSIAHGLIAFIIVYKGTYQDVNPYFLSLT